MNLKELKEKLEKEREEFKSFTAMFLPDNPSDRGYSAEDIKKTSYIPDIANYDNLVKITELSKNIEEELNSCIQNVEQLIFKSKHQDEISFELDKKIKSLNDNFILLNNFCNEFIERKDDLLKKVENDNSFVKESILELKNKMLDIATRKELESKTTLEEVKEYLLSIGVQDQIEEYDSLEKFPEHGDKNVFYIAKDSNLLYRFTGSTYACFSSPLTLGESENTAYSGNKGLKNANDIKNNANEILSIKTDINGLANLLSQVPETIETYRDNLKSEIEKDYTNIETFNNKVNELNEKIEINKNKDIQLENSLNEEITQLINLNNKIEEETLNRKNKTTELINLISNKITYNKTLEENEEITPLHNLVIDNHVLVGMKGDKGEKGEKGDIGIPAGFDSPEAYISTLQPYENASVSINSTGSNEAKKFIFNFRIPKGEKGEPGMSLIPKYTFRNYEEMINNFSNFQENDILMVEEIDKTFTLFVFENNATRRICNFTTIKGEKGEQGIQGLKGDKGDKGEQGIQGIQGIKGDKGLNGEKGARGDKGEKGEKGDKGDTPKLFIDNTYTSNEPRVVDEIRNLNEHHLSFYIPKGEKGGDKYTISVSGATLTIKENY